MEQVIRFRKRVWRGMGRRKGGLWDEADHYSGSSNDCKDDPDKLEFGIYMDIR